jgi:predicted membrane channel-forming protein YqfA (hemolysin III family)
MISVHISGAIEMLTYPSFSLDAVPFFSSVPSIPFLQAAETSYTDYHFWACVLYSFSLMFLFLSSTLFHSFFMLPQSEYKNDQSLFKRFSDK